MRTLLACSLLASSLAAEADAGCSRDTAGTGGTPFGASAPAAAIASVSVDELDAMLARHACQAVDANGDATRRRMGIIPGAVLLRDLDAVDQLPGDRSTSLVFYCANPACGASHEAAQKAVAAGYTRARVLPDGIAGWVKAGKRTASL